MPYPMAHLMIARQVLAQRPMQDPAAFVLGTLAPDAVHFRPGYHSGMKKITHFVEDDLPWGENLDTAQRQRSVWDFAKKDRQLSPDFRLGYCVHLLSDICWAHWFYQPLILSLPGAERARAEEATRADQAEMDARFSVLLRREAMWQLLREAVPEGLPGVVEQGEVQAIRDSILGEQYADRREDPSHVFTRLTPARMQWFIKAVPVAMESFFQHVFAG